VRDGAPGLLQRFPHHLAAAVDVAHAGGKDAAQRRTGGKTLHELLAGTLATQEFGGLAQQIGRNDLVVAQGVKALEDDREGDDRGNNQRPDGPAGGFDEGNHACSRVRVKRR